MLLIALWHFTLDTRRDSVLSTPITYTDIMFSHQTNLLSSAETQPPESTDSDLTYFSDSCDNADMSSQRSRAPRGGPRTGTHDTGEETQLWNETQEKLVKLQKNETRAKELRKEIFDKEASMKSQEDAGTSTNSIPLIRNSTNAGQSHPLRIWTPSARCIAKTCELPKTRNLSWNRRTP